MSIPSLHHSDDGAGPPVLLVHGQPGDGGDWAAVASLLRPTHRVIVPDRPGYGRTGGPAVGLGDNARALEELMVGLRTGPATVVGYSYGGLVALRLAEIAGGLVSALVLVASAGTRSALGWADRVLAIPGVGDALTFAGMRGLGHLAHWAERSPLAARVSDLGGVAGLSPDRLRAQASAWRSGPLWRSFAVEQRALLDETPAVEAGLGSVAVPVFVVAGRRDPMVPPRASVELAGSIPGATLVWVPGGHLVPWQAPEKVAEVISRAAGGGGQASRSTPDGRE